MGGHEYVDVVIPVESETARPATLRVLASAVEVRAGTVMELGQDTVIELGEDAVTVSLVCLEQIVLGLEEDEFVNVTAQAGACDDGRIAWLAVYGGRGHVKVTLRMGAFGEPAARVVQADVPREQLVKALDQAGRHLMGTAVTPLEQHGGTMVDEARGVSR